MRHTKPAADLVTRDRIAKTAKAVSQHLRRTPVLETAGRDFGLTARFVFKIESLQHSGSFKARGAFANLLLRDVPAVGVVAASGGNHGAAVAYAARSLGIAAKIFVPSISSPAKIERIRGYGANLVISGDRYDGAFAASEAWAAESGAMRVHAFDQVETMLGQGTVALEWDEQSPGLDTVLVGVGGGGLIAGIAAWFAGATDVIGVEPELSPTLHRALAAGRPVDAETDGIAADSLAPRRVGDLVFPIIRRYVRHVVLVSDTAIINAQRALWSKTRIAAEPGGAAALAALLSGRYEPHANERLGVLVSGGNLRGPIPRKGSIL